jgi:regulator of protease activity HflC (stomatin/prohibitin superfamily)
MIETATLITLCMLYLIFFRPGKTPPLENSLVIERAGQYHLTLEPRLNLAQSFIEAIAAQLASSAVQNTAPQFFEVRDKQVNAHGYDFYLLAITRRNGLWFFQAVRPVSGEVAAHTVSKFSAAVLARYPLENDLRAGGEDIVAAVQSVALSRDIQVKSIAC